MLGRKNRPYVTLSLPCRPNWTPISEVINEGNDVEWDFAEMPDWNSVLTKKELEYEKLCVSVIDKHKSRPDVLIGKGMANLSKLVDNGVQGEAVDFDVELSNDAGKMSGFAKLTLMLQSVDVEVDSTKNAIVKDFTQATLCIRQIEASDMKNVEALAARLLGDKNDPYATIKFAHNQWEGATRDDSSEEGWHPRTATIQEAGENAKWDMRDIRDKKWRIPITREELLSQKLEVILTDENRFSSDVVIGSAELSVKALVDVGIHGGNMVVTGTLHGSDKKPAGNVKVTVCLVPMKEVHSMTTDFEKAKLYVQHIHAKNLPNMESVFDSILKAPAPLISAISPPAIEARNDPYVQVGLTNRASWKVCTPTHWNGGSRVVWDLQKRQLGGGGGGGNGWNVKVSKEELLSEKLTIAVKDKNNVLQDKLIGDGVVDLSPLVDHGVGGGLCILTGPLNASDTASSTATSGSVLLSVSLVEEGNPNPRASSVKGQGGVEPAVAKHFQEAVLCVRSIEASHMVNVERTQLGVDQNDPYATVSFATNNWEAAALLKGSGTGTGWRPRTVILPEAGAYARWEMSDITDGRWRMRVTRQQVETESFSVTLIDENNLSADVVIGTAEMRLTQLLEKGVNGGEVEVCGELRRDQKLMGKVVVKLCLQSIDSIPRGNSHFSTALLRIHAIEAIDLANIETVIPLPTMFDGKNIDYSKRVSSHPVTHLVRRDAVANFLLGAVSAMMLLHCTVSVSDMLVRSILGGRGLGFGLGYGGAAIVCAWTCLSAHRLLGLLATQLGGVILSRACGGGDVGSYNIQIGWISLRGGLDRTELVVRNVVWLNHPAFTKTPFFVYIKELSVSVDIESVLAMVRGRGPLKIDRVYVDTLELHTERVDDGDVQGESDEATNPSPQAVAGAGAVAVKYPLNVWAALGVPFQKGLVEGVLDNLKKSLDGSAAAAMDSLRSLFSSRKAHSGSSSSVTCGGEAKAVKPVPATTSTHPAPAPPAVPLLLDVNNVLILDVHLHPLNLLSATHLVDHPNTDLCLSEVSVRRNDFQTLQNKSGSGSRSGMPLMDVISLLISKVVDKFLEENKGTTARLLAVLAGNNLTSMVVPVKRRSSHLLTTTTTGTSFK